MLMVPEINRTFTRATKGETKMREINTWTEKGQDLYIVTITIKGQTKKTEIGVYAKNRLDASNILIRKGIFGTQHEIRPYYTGVINR